VLQRCLFCCGYGMGWGVGEGCFFFFDEVLVGCFLCVWCCVLGVILLCFGWSIFLVLELVVGVWGVGVACFSLFIGLVFFWCCMWCFFCVGGYCVVALLVLFVLFWLVVFFAWASAVDFVGLAFFVVCVRVGLW